MSTYVNSQYAAKTGQGRHERRRRINTDVLLQIGAMLAAFCVSAAALSGGMVLLNQAGVSVVAMAPAATLLFASGVAFLLMALVAGR